MSENRIILGGTNGKKVDFHDDSDLRNGGVSSIFGQQIVVHYGYPGIRIPIGDTIDYPVTVYSESSFVPIANFNIPLATNNTYITFRDSAGSTCNSFFNFWDDRFFNRLCIGYPSPGWTIEAFMGFADLGGPPNPQLNAHDSLTVCHFRMITVNDTNLINHTANVFISGQHPLSGILSFGDSVGGPGYTNIQENIYQVTFCACADSDHIGTGMGVMGNQQNHVDAICSGDSVFSLIDISRRNGYDPHGHGGHLPDIFGNGTYIWNP